jgi:hypothetical protein
MQVFALYMLMCAAASFLLVRATITEWLWSRYPYWLDSYLSCTACSGFALGLIAAVVGGWCFDFDFLGFAGRTWMAVLASGMSAMVVVPIIAWAQTNALIQLGGGLETVDPSTEFQDALAAANAIADRRAHPEA